jgi:deazaflavin-dependent oxidoreductase (nitroreductase family)
VSDWNSQVIEEFRANAGQVGGQFTGAPILLLHTSGAKTGQARVHPMMYLNGGDRLWVFASKNGAPTNPAWYHNLKTHPEVTVEVGTEKYRAVATEITGEEHDKIYAEQAFRYPGFAEYQEKTTRVIPVIALTRQGD